LLGQACRKAKIKLLCVAHHGDDQMETILFRLAKGSGLDGLSGMVPIHRLDEVGVTLLRPLLETSHDSLLATCRARHIPWTEDPSNEKTDYARVRMRGARAVLEREGFTLDRLITAARRFDRASRALGQLSEKEYKNCVLSKETKRIEINFFNLKSQPEELVFRILKMAIVDVTEGRGPVIRLQRLEALVTRILTDPSFRGATLGGAMLRLYPARANGDGLLVIMPEAFGSP
jgi:tRNA(Ile)-lysidine synthase